MDQDSRYGAAGNASRGRKWRSAILFVVMLLPACQFFVIVHDEDRAAAEAAAVLKLVYLDGDFQAAYRRLDSGLRPKTSPEQLASIAKQLDGAFGPLTRLTLEQYLPVGGQRMMKIFFTGSSERGVTFHQVTMIGDIRGYRVGGLFFAPAPYPEATHGHRFSRPMVLVRQASG